MRSLSTVSTLPDFAHYKAPFSRPKIPNLRIATFRANSAKGSRSLVPNIGARLPPSTSGMGTYGVSPAASTLQFFHEGIRPTARSPAWASPMSVPQPIWSVRLSRRQSGAAFIAARHDLSRPAVLETWRLKSAALPAPSREPTAFPFQALYSAEPMRSAGRVMRSSPASEPTRSDPVRNVAPVLQNRARSMRRRPYSLPSGPASIQQPGRRTISADATQTMPGRRSPPALAPMSGPTLKLHDSSISAASPPRPPSAASPGASGSSQNATTERAEIHLDGQVLGQWILNHLEHSLTRPQTTANFITNRGASAWSGQVPFA